MPNTLPQTTNQTAALDYAAQGFAVLPLHWPVNGGCSCFRGDECEHPGKHPIASLVPRGLHSATTDPDVIRRWWTDQPEANIGLRTGDAFDVIDVDSADGQAALDALVAEHGTPYTLAVARSGRDGHGRHVYVSPGGQKALSGGRTAPAGVDVKGNGGYVVAPPSQHVSGALYTWERAPGGELHGDTEWPDFYRCLSTTPERASMPLSVATVTGTTGPLSRAVSMVLGAENGHRWQTLATEAVPLVARAIAGGSLDRDTAIRELTDAAQQTGLTTSEIYRVPGLIDDMVPRVTDPISPLDVTPLATDRPTNKRRVRLTKASDITPERARWAWRDRLPMGELTLIAGREGIGKSTLAYQIAADLTRGRLDGEHLGQPKNVVVAATEDSWSHTIVPRLIAAGADLDRVSQIEVSTSEGFAVGLSLPDDIAETIEVLAENDTALLLLDPLMSRLDGKLDTHKDAEVRRALEPLVLAAQQSGTAIAGLIHVTKATTSDPMNAIMGSRAFAAVARAVVFVMLDPDNETVRLVGQPKSNLGPTDIPTLTFTLETAPQVATATDGRPIQSTRIRWGDDRTDTIRDMMETASDSAGNRSIVKEAADWLSDYLVTQGGTAVRADVTKAARAAGFTDDQMNRARTKLKIATSNVPGKMPRQTQWSLGGVVPLDAVAA